MATPLTLDRIFGWHVALFPKGVPDGFQTLPAGELRGTGPMVVATLGRRPEDPELVHFEAPGRAGLEAELEAFLAWFNAPPPGLNGLLRAGVAHLWFVTLHPMADGNGRLSRTLTDLALAQVEAAARQGIQEVGRVLARRQFWAEVRRLVLNERQERVLQKVLSPMTAALAVSNRRYRAITKTSRATAVRDLAELADLGLVVPFGAARSASYRVDLDRFLPEAFRT